MCHGDNTCPFKVSLELDVFVPLAALNPRDPEFLELHEGLREYLGTVMNSHTPLRLALDPDSLVPSSDRLLRSASGKVNANIIVNATGAAIGATNLMVVQQLLDAPINDRFSVQALVGFQREPVCGNGLCEQGERCDKGSVEDCDPLLTCVEDCPLSTSFCPYVEGSSVFCSGHGSCQPVLGECLCYDGYFGVTCEICKDGYFRLNTNDPQSPCLPAPPPSCYDGAQNGIETGVDCIQDFYVFTPNSDPSFAERSFGCPRCTVHIDAPSNAWLYTGYALLGVPILTYFLRSCLRYFKRRRYLHARKSAVLVPLEFLRRVTVKDKNETSSKKKNKKKYEIKAELNETLAAALQQYVRDVPELERGIQRAIRQPLAHHGRDTFEEKKTPTTPRGPGADPSGAPLPKFERLNEWRHAPMSNEYVPQWREPSRPRITMNSLASALIDQVSQQADPTVAPILNRLTGTKV